MVGFYGIFSAFVFLGPGLWIALRFRGFGGFDSFLIAFLRFGIRFVFFCGFGGLGYGIFSPFAFLGPGVGLLCFFAVLEGSIRFFCAFAVWDSIRFFFAVLAFAIFLIIFLWWSGLIFDCCDFSILRFSGFAAFRGFAFAIFAIWRFLRFCEF